MVYKKFIKKNGKVFGPYYYESYRDEMGKAKKRYFGSVNPEIKENSISKKNVFVLAGILFLLILGLAFSSQLTSERGAHSGVFNNLISNSFKSVGFVISGNLTENKSVLPTINKKKIGKNATSRKSNSTVEKSKKLPVENASLLGVTNNSVGEINKSGQEDNSSSYGDGALNLKTQTNQTTENQSTENQTFPNQTQTQTNQTFPVIENQTSLNLTIENQTNQSTENQTFPNQTQTNQTSLNLTIENQTSLNLTIENQTNQTNISVAVFANTTTLQYKAVVGLPVKWIKKINVSERNLTVELPKGAKNISVLTGGEVDSALSEVNKSAEINKTVGKSMKGGFLTGNVVSGVEGDGILMHFWNWIKSFTISGNVVKMKVQNMKNLTVVNLSKMDISSSVKKIAVTYYTPAPIINETNWNGKKRIVVSAPSELNYTKILAYTSISGKIRMNDSHLKLYWYNDSDEENNTVSGLLKNGSSSPIQVKYVPHDINGDGFVDYIEWVVPHLSTQLYEVIYVTKAEHLDANRTFISDIYPEVRAKDGNWSEAINNGEYVRATFEIPLDSSRDITFYGKSLNGSSRVEVYEENKTKLIATFGNVSSAGWYKIYLTNLTDSQEVFDLKIIGSVSFDYIVDPTNPFNSTWNTSAVSTGSSNSTQISLPLVSTGTYNFSVDWGDGTNGTVTSWTQGTHNYAVAGIYNITISGTIIGFSFNNSGDRLKILDVSNWGNLNVGNGGGYFYGCSNLNSTASDSLNLTGTTDLGYMFAYATNFDGDISGWNVSGVSDMSNMFLYASNFNQPLNNWNTSSVNDMTSMFYFASNFNQPLNNWDVSSVTSMGRMFKDAINFNGNISIWNVSSVLAMDSMFYSVSSFNQPLNNWNTSSVTDMDYMFYQASNFNQPLNNWDVSSVTNMGSMFRGASSFNQPLNNWSTSLVTNMYGVFYGASSFNQPLNNWNTSSATNMYRMFQSASSFNQPLNNWNISSVTTMGYMFNSASNFNQPLNNWNTSSVTDINNMFGGASFFNGNISNWNTSSITDMQSMLNGASSFNQPLNNWDVSSVANMYRMFQSASNFNQPLNNWNTSSVTNMGYMFGSASNFNQPLNNWNVSSVTSMDHMFYYASSFNGSISSWDVSKVTSMSAMFYRANYFDGNLSLWNVSSVTSMGSMFHFIALSTSNYDSLLNGWASLLSLQKNVSFDGGNSRYTSLASSARQDIINKYNWTISDGGWISSAPIEVSSRIYSFSNMSSEDLLAYCNASDIDGDNLYYYYRWFKNGVLSLNGLTPSSYSQGVEINIYNLSSQNLANNDSWILSCLSNDGTHNSSWINSSAVLIINPDLKINNVSVPSVVYSNTTLVKINISDESSSSAYGVNVSCYLDGVLFDSKNVSVVEGRSSLLVNCSMDSKSGFNKLLSVVVDPLNNIVEINESNNNWSKYVDVLQLSSLDVWGQDSRSGWLPQQETLPREMTYFFTNWTMDNSSAEIKGANCNISFNGGNENGVYDLLYNDSVSLYYYNRTFDYAGNYSWVVRCSKVGFEPLSNQGVERVLIPLFNYTSLGFYTKKKTVNYNESINLSLYIPKLDIDSNSLGYNLSSVWVQIVSPNGSVKNVSLMGNKDGGIQNFIYSSPYILGRYIVTYFANLTNGFNSVLLSKSNFSLQNTSITINVVSETNTTNVVNVAGKIQRTNGSYFWTIPNNLFNIKLNNVFVSSNHYNYLNFSKGISDGNVNMSYGDLKLNLTSVSNITNYSDDYITTKYIDDSTYYNNVGWSSGHLFDINNMVGNLGNITYKFSSITKFYNASVYMSTAGASVGGGNDSIYYSFDNISWVLLANTTLTGVRVGGVIPVQGEREFYVKFASDKTVGDNPISSIEIDRNSYQYSALGEYVSDGIFLQGVTYTTLSWDNILDGGAVKLQLRESDDGVSWSGWSSNFTNNLDNDITSFSKNYLQYRVWLYANNLSFSPVVQDVNISYFNASTNSTGGYSYNVTIPTNNLGNLPMVVSVVQNPVSGITGSNITNLTVWSKTVVPYYVVKNYSGNESNYSIYVNFTREVTKALVNGTIEVLISNSSGSWSRKCVAASSCVASWVIPNDLLYGNYTINVFGYNESGYYRNSSVVFNDYLEGKTTTGSVFSANKTIGDYSYGNEYSFYWDVVVNNTGSASMNNIDVYAPVFGSAVKNITKVSSCSKLYPNQSCNVKMLIVMKNNAAPGQYYITWRSNWTDNDGSVAGGAGYIQYTGMYVIIVGNATLQLSNYSVIKTVQHNSSSGFIFQEESIGSDIVTNINNSFVSQNITPTSLAIPRKWISINPEVISTIPQGTNMSVALNISVPAQTSPGNYTGFINVSSSDSKSLRMNLTIIVPVNSSWYFAPKINFSYNHSFSLNKPGEIGNWTIFDNGNVNLTMNISYTHSGISDFSVYPNLFSENNPDGTNPTSVNITKGGNTTFIVWENGWDSELKDIGIIVGISNSSGVPVKSSVEDAWSTEEQPPKISGVWFYLDGNESNISEQNKNFTLKFRATDDVALNKSGATFNISWSGGQTSISAGDLSAVYGQYNLSGSNYVVLNYSSNYIPATADVYHVVASVKDNTGKVSVSGQYNFTVYGSTTVGLSQNVSVVNISDIDLNHEGFVYVNYTINNSGLVTAYSPNLSFSKDNAISIDDYTFSNLYSGGVSSKVIRINVSKLTLAGSYSVNANLQWKNPNGVPVSKNVILVINVGENKSFSHSPTTLVSVVNSGSSNYSLLRINNTGNSLLSNMNLNCYAGSLCSNFNIIFNDSDFNILINSSKLINMSIIAPVGLAAGNYVGAINVSEKNISNVVDAQVTVPQLKTWNISLSSINSTKGVSSYGKLAEVKISNNGNVNMTFDLSSTNNSLISTNESSIMVPLASEKFFMINYSAPSIEDSYFAKIVVKNVDSSATPAVSNISVNLTTTRLNVDIISPTNVSLLNEVIAGQKIFIVANLTYHGVVVTGNSTWTASIGGASCSNISYFYNSIGGYWNISCYAPNILDGGLYSLTTTVNNNQYGEIIDTKNNVIRYKDLSSPVFNVIQRNNIEKGNYIDLRANVTDNVKVGGVSALLNYPNGTIKNYNMVLVNGLYSLSSVFLDSPGEYIVNYTANDSSGNSNTASDWFEVYDRYYWNVSLSDVNSHPVSKVNISLKRPKTSFVLVNGSTDLSGNANLFVNKRFYDLYANISGERIVIRNVNFTNITQSNMSLNFYKMNSGDFIGNILLFKPFVGLISNSSGFLKNNISIIFNYSGYLYSSSSALRIVKCSNWNWTKGDCNGTWESINFSRNVNAKTVSGNSIGFATYFLAEDECGNGLCEVNYGETTSTCSADCKASVTGAVSSSGGGGGGGGGGSSISQTDLDKIESLIRNFLNVGGVKLETSSIYRELFAGDTATITIRLRNTLLTPSSLSLSADGDIKKFMFFNNNNIMLNGTEDRTSLIKVVIPRDIKPGSYNGNFVIKSKKQVGKIPVTIRILQPQGKLLDVKIQPLTPSVAPGKVLRLQTDISNLGRTNRVDIQFDLELLDISTGVIITRNEQAFSVKTSISVVKNLTIPKNIKSGKYMVKATAYYSNVEFKNMHATSLAYINVQYPFFSRKIFGIPYWIYSLLFLVAGIAVGGFFYYRWLDYKKKRFKIKVDLRKLPQPTEHSGFVGKIAETGIRAFMDLNKLQMHTIIAGATGGGKTVAAQDIVEDVLSHNKGVIIFDPTAQWTGFLRKCEDDTMLKRYKYFDMKTGEAKAFNGSIKTINDPYELIDLKKYMDLKGEITIFNVSNLSPKEIDIVVASTIEQLFKLKLEESRELKTLIVYDEVHRLLPKFGGSGKGFVQIERGAREFRKWGVGLVLISQVLSDFIGDIKANIGTEIQMGTRYEGDLDRVKMKYGEDALKSVVKAPIGTGLVVNAEYNSGRPYFVSFRPSLHSTKRLSNDELKKYEIYTNLIDDLEYQISRLKFLKSDIFDLELELKLTKGKIKSGQFQMADMYLDSLKPKIEDHWTKIGKSPEHIVKQKISEQELSSGIEKANQERVKYIKKNTQENVSFDQEISDLKKQAQGKKQEGKSVFGVESMIAGIEERLRGYSKEGLEKDRDAVMDELNSIKKEMEKI